MSQISFWIHNHHPSREIKIPTFASEWKPAWFIILPQKSGYPYFTGYRHTQSFDAIARKVFSIELLHEQLPLPVPCYDLLPVIELTLGPACARTSGTPNSLELTGGEYKT